MADEKLPWITRALYNRPGFAWLGMFAVGALCWVLLLSGCTTVGRNYDSRYYYVAEMPLWLIAYVQAQADIEILMWQDYRRRARALGCAGSSMACTRGNSIILLAGSTCEQYLESIYHEAGHWRDAIEATGSNRHSGKDWSSSKPYGYDNKVKEAMQDFVLVDCDRKQA